jgi:hypothetical protein
MTDSDQAALAGAFAAAREAEAGPSPALLSAILADAAAVSADRRPPPRPAARPGARPRPGLRLRLRGDWRAAGALAAAAALGLWIGLAGDLGVADPAAWTGEVAAETDADPVAAFFDLAAVEN